MSHRACENRRRRPARKRNHGFTLIEIVVALALIGGVMFVLLETHFRALRLYEAARDEVTIRNFLSQAAGRAETEVLAGNLGGDGDFGERYPDYTYKFEAQQMGEGSVLLYDVLVTVEEPGGETHELVFLVYDPRTGGGGVATGSRSSARTGGASGINLGGLSSRPSGSGAGTGQ